MSFFDLPDFFGMPMKLGDWFMLGILCCAAVGVVVESVRDVFNEKKAKLRALLPNTLHESILAFDASTLKFTRHAITGCTYKSIVLTFDEPLDGKTVNTNALQGFRINLDASLLPFYVELFRTTVVWSTRVAAAESKLDPAVKIAVVAIMPELTHHDKYSCVSIVLLVPI